MRVKRCGAGQGMETPGTVTEDWGPEQGSGDAGQQGSDGQQGSLQLLLRDTSCGYGTQARPLPWMPGPVGEFQPHGPCRSCDFLRAGRLQKPLRMWSGVQSVSGPWLAPPKASSNYHPKSGLSRSLPSFQLMVGGMAQAGLRDPDPDHGGGVLTPGP